MKKIITGTFLLFILVSVTYIGFQQVKPSKPNDSQVGLNALPLSEKVDERLAVRAYYFHGTQRCATCRKIESYSREALQSAFAKALSDKKLDFVVVNVEQPGNAHFVKHYKLASSSIVLTRYDKGEQTAWKNLEQVWPLAADKPGFIRYIQAETGKMLEK